ncbi:transmembrane protein 201 [Dendroctonus ponderosae]|uniref:transmembrane protein 201 n=1 Tax=Dendroctonus ponderosae TaxID=77166 RepID=UPI00203502CE|nr:transmembrane protein 201 [Dendroctonus ponderosae]KAH1003354.1 hypothetical protein HUJ05_011278 [Dendroctonus ponderosae]
MDNKDDVFFHISIHYPPALRWATLLLFAGGLAWRYVFTQANCWYCNKNTRVLCSWHKRFVCPNCEQYNGFDKDGGYDRVIEEQHREAPGAGNGGPPPQNGLCEPCNRNQEMRVRHLADFVPLREWDYDREVEHFEKQLEKSFGLCGACEALVKATIRQQNAWIFGNMLRSSGRVHRRIRRTVSPLAALLLLLSLGSWGCFWGLLPHAVPLPPDLQQAIGAVPPLLLLTALGFTVEALLGRSPNLLKLNNLLAWGVLGLTGAAPFTPSAALYRDTLQVFCSLYLSYAYGSACLTTPRQKKKRRRVVGDPTAATACHPQLPPQPQKLPPELNEHFNELNIGPPTAPKARPASPNPFGWDCGAGGDAHVVERPPRTLLSPSRLGHVTAYPDAPFVIGQMRTRYVSGFYGEGPYWTPVYTAKAHYF